MLLAKVDEITGKLAELVAEVREVTEQLEPERARSCRNAITMCSVMSTRSGCGPTPGRSANPTRDWRPTTRSTRRRLT
jgi:hypothetical protein